MLETPVENQSDRSEQRGGLLHAYPYAFAILGVVIILGAGAFVVQQRLSTAPPPPRTGAWSGNISTLLGPFDYGAAQESVQRGRDIMNHVQQSAPYTYKIPILTPQPPPPSQENPASIVLQNDAFDYDAFIAFLSHAGMSTSSTDQNSVPSAYAYIPSGLISTQVRAKERSAAQENLYNYGNDVGSALQTFENNHKNEAQVLKDQMQDPQDAAKLAAVMRLAADLENVGVSLKTLDQIPQQMRTLHMALAKSYETMGQNLRLVPTTKTPRDFLAAIDAYNKSADEFVRSFVAVATLFSANGVTFAAEDPGSVFTFTNTGGL
ncbi:MAG: hypothetical protein UY70_C0011G0023 [Candidatus Kaiserbacteria bacterium GW2011_GWB1_52_6]|uniref:Uncharacterized protein n=3 Tax=Candidatus Kaiseribacteriota TaxID=1752734 RepID=A0A0G1XHZ3_9BACT|nr:MAG: hypothetical protein UY67_C0003G0035 [Candidatus Kaiserbacteria bacterium GW2011_GWA2_52_12]KKW27589.1 MAG: hypothetical protein UY70_C0011G0023 [Candidatus Kaiserbacteria bacterium GW2011_GWB1_52_6]KKW30863.1 MAG: hypothetical protein UY74_C0030G0001 [Candidatus Kaiserbacteria bacterium GW2011_GWC2_52_8b]